MKAATAVLMGVLLCCSDTPAQAQGASPLSLSVLLIDDDPFATTARFWIQVRNHSSQVQMLCRASWGYTWTTTKDGSTIGGGSGVGPHGCRSGDDDNFWLVLPGESRFELLSINRLPGDASLSVDVELVDAVSASRGTLRWKGQAAEAVANATRLRIKLPGP